MLVAEVDPRNAVWVKGVALMIITNGLNCHGDEAPIAK